MRILVADDDPVPRLLLDRALRDLGHEVLVAEDGEQAWTAYLAHLPDCVVTDWMMPVADGLELSRRIRGHPHSGYTYIILATALSEKDHVLEAMEAGADDYVTKPFTTTDLRIRLVAAQRVTDLYGRLAAHQRELENLNARLADLARRDPLTGVGNRLRLAEDLEQLAGRGDRYGHAFSIVLFDVDRFKEYNDRHGHLRGDEVLSSVADALVKACRAGDAVYRFGGEELLCVLPEQDRPRAIEAAERLRAAVEAAAIPHPENDPFGVVTVSGGVAVRGSRDELTTDELLRQADRALYDAKRDGRNRITAAVPASSAEP